MHKRLSLLLVLTSMACTQTKSIEANLEPSDHFENLNGCFLLYNMKTNQLEKVIGQENCEKRLLACSTFKVPLAAMALDSKVIQGENDPFKWNGKPGIVASWNQDQTTYSWMKNSVVWVSQLLTPKIGMKKIKKYLRDFKYGTEDMSGGIKAAWLTSENGTLKISAYEQLEFMKRLWKNELPISDHAMEVTRKITKVEVSENGFELHGKTGSGFLDPRKHYRIGWFIGHIAKGDQEYIAITSFTDQLPQEEPSFGGLRARAITKFLLSEQNLW